MKVNKVTVYYSQTVQMRQFEPVAVSLSMEAEVDPGEDQKNVARRLLAQVKSVTDDEVTILKLKRKKSFLEPDDDSLDKNV